MITSDYYIILLFDLNIWLDLCACLIAILKTDCVIIVFFSWFVYESVFLFVCFQCNNLFIEGFCIFILDKCNVDFFLSDVGCFI